MSTLANELQRFLDFLGNQGLQPPTRKSRIVEIPQGAPVDPLGRIRLQRHEVRDPADYEARFDELMKAGLPWLNVSCYGVEEGTLIVGIEVPAVPPKPSSRTSVNFSGPTAKVVGSGWKIDQVLAID
jgi:hypothetical protein